MATIYTVNEPGSGTYSIPNEIVPGDTLEFNYTSSAVTTVTSGYNQTGTIMSFIVPATGKYKITATGAGGSIGNQYNLTPPPTWRGGYGAIIQGTTSLIAGRRAIVVVGNKGSRVGFNSVKDGATGGSGGGTFLFQEDSLGLYTINGIRYALVVCAASGGGANDAGYQNRFVNGDDCSSIVVMGENFPSSKIIDYISRKFVGYTHARGVSKGFGGFGGGRAADDAKNQATPVGYFVSDSFSAQTAAPRSFFINRSAIFVNRNENYDNGHLTLEFINKSIYTTRGFMGFTIDNNSSFIPTPIYIQSENVRSDSVGDRRINTNAKGETVLEICTGDAQQRGDGVWQEILFGGLGLPTRREIDLTEQIDGITQRFNLPNSLGEDHDVYYNGMHQKNNTDYAIEKSGEDNFLVMKRGDSPKIGDSLYIIYR